MAEYIIKNIVMTLDEESVKQAVKDVEEIQRRLKPAMQCLIDYLGEKGVTVARASLLMIG